MQKQNDFQFEEKEFLPVTSELQKTLKDSEDIVDNNKIMRERGAVFRQVTGKAFRFWSQTEKERHYLRELVSRHENL